MSNVPLTLLRPTRSLPGSVFGLGQSCEVAALSIGPAALLGASLRIKQCCEVLDEKPPHIDGTDIDKFWFGFAKMISALLRNTGWSTRHDFHVEMARNDGTHRVSLLWPVLYREPLQQALPKVIALVNASDAHEIEAIDESMRAITAELANAYPFKTNISRRYFCEAANAMRIPHRYVNSILVLGVSRQHKCFRSNLSSDTPYIGGSIVSDKASTAAWLKRLGLPAPLHQQVKSEDEAVQVAERLGYPVVVKPADRDRGEGVYAGLTDPQQVRTAFTAAAEWSSKILLEKFVSGFTHRFMVVNEQVIRVVRRLPGGIHGDGERTVRELVFAKQSTDHDESQGWHESPADGKVSLDSEALDLLAEQSLKPTSVVQKGKFVRLRRRDNINSGGTNEELDYTQPQIVHPDNLQLAIDATHGLGLDISGVDIIADDIAISWLDSTAVICEINLGPQMSGRNDPHRYKRLLKECFPSGWSVPVKLILLPSDTVKAQPLIESIRQKPDHCAVGVGVSSHDGLWIAGRRASKPFDGYFEAADALLLRRDIERCILIITPYELLTFGFPLAQIDSLECVALEHFSKSELQQIKTVKQWYALENQWYAGAQ